MSRFSGKCDFYDEIEIFGLDKILKSEVYVGDSDEPLKLNCLADCVPYYPYVVVTSATSGDRATIRLTSKSWVDIEEDRYGHFASHDYYRKILQEEIKTVLVENEMSNFGLQRNTKLTI